MTEPGDIKGEAVVKLFDIYKETMLSPRDVLSKAIKRAIPKKAEATYIKKNFSKLIDLVGKEAYGIFLVEQEKAGKRAISKYFELLTPSVLKNKVVHYKKAVNVLSFEEFFLDYLDPAVKRWQKLKRSSRN